MLPQTPNPFPTLREGLALGAAEHRGFIAVWNWICGIMRKAKDYFCLGVNGRTGDVNIVAGTGINVTAEGNTITISTGDGSNTDNGGGHSGSGGGSGSGGSGGGRTGGSTGGDWTRAARPSTTGDGGCNLWAQGSGMGNNEPPENEHDNCAELNGW